MVELPKGTNTKSKSVEMSPPPIAQGNLRGPHTSAFSPHWTPRAPLSFPSLSNPDWHLLVSGSVWARPQYFGLQSWMGRIMGSAGRKL